MSRVPPSASGSTSGAENEVDKLEELGDDAIVAHQQGAHMPQPRAQVTEEARSIVISDRSSPSSDPPASQERKSRRRSERTEKTVVIRSRRQIEDLQRAMAQHKLKASGRPKRGLLLWVLVGLVAFLAGGLVAVFAMPTRESAAPLSPSAALPSTAQPLVPAPATVEPPSVSIDELPIEGHSKRK
ncbi:MAG TPA: hypothetical protein VEQ58_20935 [Polyangiaceae bacterium]|nr:hypothetical protein [Polyangiaceae bacterium]